MEAYGKALATIESVDDDDLIYGPNGGFTAVLSTPSVDRDGDSLLRDEWVELPEHCTLDMDHGMTVATTIGSFTPYWGDDGSLMMRAAFSSIERAQEARTLVKEGHVRDVSVAFMTDKTKKSGEPRRELLNAGIVGVGSNRDAKIMDSKSFTPAESPLDSEALDRRAQEIPTERAIAEVMKAVLDGTITIKESQWLIAEINFKAPKPYGDVHYADPEEGKYPIDTVAHIRAALSYIGMPRNRAALGSHLAHVEAAIHAAARAHGINVHEGRSVEAAEEKSVGSVYIDVIPRLVGTKAPMGTGDNPALTQAIHDAAVHLGAACYPLQPDDEDPTGATDGANKDVTEVETEEVEAETKDTPEEEVIETIPDDSPLGQWLAQFEKRLSEKLIGTKEPAELPADEAAAASEEEPAPADTKAAEDAADDVTRMAELMRMQLALRDK